MTGRWADRRTEGADHGQHRWCRVVAAADGIGQSLLDRGLGPGRPLLILSGNSVPHLLLTLDAAQDGPAIVATGRVQTGSATCWPPSRAQRHRFLASPRAPGDPVLVSGRPGQLRGVHSVNRIVLTARLNVSGPPGLGGVLLSPGRSMANSLSSAPLSR
jgi:hypothetical protein